MTPAERVARLKQLYDQVKALNEEIAQLEAEDPTFVAFKQRSQPAAPATPTRPSAAPVAAATPSRSGGATSPAASSAQGPLGPARSAPTTGRPGSRSSTAPTQISPSQLIEMHSPILNEVGDLTRR